MVRATRVYKSFSRNALALVTLLLIAFAIALYGGEYVWQEAAILIAVFLVSGATFFLEPAQEASDLPWLLFVPLGLLAAYSFLQGMIPLVSEAANTGLVGYIPYAFDSISSLWSGLKLVAFVCLLRLCLISIRISREFFIHGVVLVGSGFAALGILRFFLQLSMPELNQYMFAPELRSGIGFGTFLNQNHFALLMLMTLGLNIGLLFERDISNAKKLALIAGSLIAWIALVLTASRAGIIGSFVVAATLGAVHVGGFISRYRRDTMSRSQLISSLAKSFASAVLIVVALVAGVVLVGQGRVLQRFSELPDQIEGVSGSGFRRADVWDATTRMIEEHYLYGIGFGGFRYGISEFIEISGDVVPKQAHNDYLELIASGGIIAAALLIGFLCTSISELINGLKKDPRRRLSGAAVGAICGIVGVAFHSFADFGLQYFGNVAFLTALISITISPVKARPEGLQTLPLRRGRILGLAATSFLGICCLVSAGFGTSRYLLSSARNDVQDRPLIEVPFDPEYHAVRSDFFSRSGNPGAAIVELRTATRLRSYDHSLWLRLAQLEAERNNPAAAEEAFRISIGLAPYYGEPRFFYGSFLLRMERTTEAVNELVLAARRDSRFTHTVLPMIWNRTAYLPEYLQYLIAGGHYKTKDSITNFLLAKHEYVMILGLVCGDGYSEMDRDAITRHLVERRAFQTAWQVHKNQCNNSQSPAAFLDGDFELSAVRKGTGFGWLLGESSERSEVAIDQSVAANGHQSLRFTFTGDSRSVLLKQALPIRKNARYTVSFFYKSKEIVSGSIPVVRFVAKQTKLDVQVAEVELSADEPEWAQRTVSFETDDMTEAIEVILTIRRCGDAACPIFGRLWLDNFQISE